MWGHKNADAEPTATDELVPSAPVAVPQDVEHKFSKYGRVKEVRIVRNPATGESRGFGFVGMSEEDEVDAVRRLRDPPASSVCTCARL